MPQLQGPQNIRYPNYEVKQYFSCKNHLSFIGQQPEIETLDLSNNVNINEINFYNLFFEDSASIDSTTLLQSETPTLRFPNLHTLIIKTDPEEGAEDNITPLPLKIKKAEEVLRCINKYTQSIKVDLKVMRTDKDNTTLLTESPHQLTVDYQEYKIPDYLPDDECEDSTENLPKSPDDEPSSIFDMFFGIFSSISSTFNIFSYNASALEESDQNLQHSFHP
ncbi:MAG: hypothetical protein DGJ47_000685, partial [Rickettsiaceae bacterium]